MKFRLLAVAIAAVAMTGTAIAQDTSSEKGRVSYAMGYDLGRNMVGVGESIDSAALVKGLNDALAKKEPAVPVAQLQAAMKSFNDRVAARDKAEFDKAAASNLVESNKFLDANKAKPGVQTLPSGVQYRVITAGKGPKPSASSTVNMKIAGPFPLGLRPEKAELAAARAVPSLKISEIPLPGLRQAITSMPAGSKWEITVPPAQGFGADRSSGQPPNVALQYEVELISAK